MRRAASESKSGDGDVPEVTAKQIEVMGSRWAGRRVRMSNCYFLGVDTWFVEYLEDALADDPPPGGVQPEPEPEGWVGFYFDDQRGDVVQYGYAAMERFGDQIVALKRGSRIRVAGVVVRMIGPLGDVVYGLVCDEVTAERKTSKPQR